MEKTIYTVDWFIDYYSKIPERLWCTNSRINDDGQRCAHGWCYPKDAGINDIAFGCSEMERGLRQIAEKTELLTVPGFAYINNGHDERYQQPTPKQRILAALRDIKAMQNKEPEVQECDATEVEKSVEVGNIKITSEFKPVSFEKITENICQLSNS